MNPVFSAPAGIGGELIPPPDKSITHRALLLGAITDGRCRVRNPLDTGDCISTLGCLRALGVRVREDERAPLSLIIEGAGLRGLREPADLLDAGNSGTTMRLLSGLLAGLPLYAVLTGDQSLLSRPMLRVVAPLRKMGAHIAGRAGGKFAPLSFLPGSGSLNPISCELKLPSAQVKSALLFAALRGAGSSVLTGRLDSRDHTERLFTYLQLPLVRDGHRLTMAPSSNIPAFDLEIPGDPSSAAFFITAAIISGRELAVHQCCLNPSRLGFIHIIRKMGCSVELHQETSYGDEPVGSLLVRPGRLSGVSISGAEAPSLIDEIPLIAVLGAFAEGVTSVHGAEELRHKESDRVEASARLISALGGAVTVHEDGFTIEGPQILKGGSVESAGDHRIAMAGAVLCAGVRDQVEVRGFDAAAVSFPDFIDDFKLLGGRVE